ncbi:MAG: outer membrane protein assembly factor [Pseudoflavonifractor sp.]|nr:outer membrane protein assembly factor [Pseudoflavonifractor sp.]
MRLLISAIILVIATAAAVAADGNRVTGPSVMTASADSISPSLPTSPQSDTTTTVVKKKENIIQRVINYFDDSNKEKKNKKFDFSIIGGPYYSSETKFGLGLVAAGLYRHDKNDTLIAPSNVSVYGNVSTAGFYEVGIRGYHIFPHDRYRLNYDLSFASSRTKFWGIGYDEAIHDSYETKYVERSVKFNAEFMTRVGHSLYVGPSVKYVWARALDTQPVPVWDGLPKRTASYGIGFAVNYDTRDVPTNAKRGMLIRIDQRCFPRFMGNDYAFSSTELTAAWYGRIWKGGILATQLHGLLTYNNTPWTMMATVGGSRSMRGYYEGRFRDKGEIDLVIELRQHVWRRNSIVVWGGAGAVFDKPQNVRWRTILPNAGIGYRWEFKKDVNVRLDFGIGRHSTGFVFSINEAF